MRNPPAFELYQGSNRYFGKPAAWYWRLRARNGKVIANGPEGYSSPAAAKRAINTLLTNVAAATTIVIVET